MKDSLVALNIIVNDKIINKNGVPILFYWNGDSSSLLKDIYSITLEINVKRIGNQFIRGGGGAPGKVH